MFHFLAFISLIKKTGKINILLSKRLTAFFYIYLIIKIYDMPIAISDVVLTLHNIE